MRRIVRLLIVLSVLIGGVVGLVASATAQPPPTSPTQPFSFHDCFASDPYRVCSTGEGLVTSVQTGSGRQVHRVKVTTTTEFFDASGQLVGSTAEQLLQFEVESKDKETVVFHREYESVTSFNGTTCTTDHSLVAAGGEFRHEVNDVVCTP